jgi:hypothetical protein
VSDVIKPCKCESERLREALSEGESLCREAKSQLAIAQASRTKRGSASAINCAAWRIKAALDVMDALSSGKEEL